MADLGTKQNWLVSPDWEVEKRWLQVQINERVSRINKTKQDIMDLKNVQLIKLEAQVIMMEQEIKRLEEKLAKKEPIEVKGGEDG